jgi:hypothetical protein
VGEIFQVIRKICWYIYCGQRKLYRDISCMYESSARRLADKKSLHRDTYCDKESSIDISCDSEILTGNISSDKETSGWWGHFLAC